MKCNIDIFMDTFTVSDTVVLCREGIFLNVVCGVSL